MEFRQPQVNLYVDNVELTAGFYARMGFKEKFRTPMKGKPVHIEMSLDNFTIGLADRTVAQQMHHIPAGDGPARAEIVIWTENTDQAFEYLTRNGATTISEPHNFLNRLRAAWIADPDGNPIQLVAIRQTLSMLLKN